MKKIVIIVAILLVLCIGIFALVKCNKNGNEVDEYGNNTSEQVKNNNNVSQSNDKADFSNEAGYRIVKSDSLSDLKYTNVGLIDDSNGQVDLQFNDGRNATLLIKKSADYMDETEYINKVIGNYEVKIKEDLDGIKRYCWEKNNTSYVFSFDKNVNFSEEDILKIINGFSIEVGENY